MKRGLRRLALPIVTFIYVACATFLPVAAAAQTTPVACDYTGGSTAALANFEAGFRRSFCGASVATCDKRWANFAELASRAFADPRITTSGTLAYLFATAWGETAILAFAPGVEIKGPHNAKRRYYIADAAGRTYQGRGWVQLTDVLAYRRAKREIGVDFVANPDAATTPEQAYELLYRSLIEGWPEVYRANAAGTRATNVPIRLTDFISAQGNDFGRARSVINANCQKKPRPGTGCIAPNIEVAPGRFIPEARYIDRALEIASQARTFERLICAAQLP